MLSIFVNGVLPVFIMAGLGVLLARSLKINARPISQLALYLFSPALIFNSLSSADVSFREVVGIFSFLALWLPLMYLVSWLAGRSSRLTEQGRSAFMLSTLFMNAVNYGLPVSLLAFGEAGLQRALLFLVPQSLLAGTLAIYVASRGQAGALRGVVTVFRMPTFYATVAALAINPFHVAFPTAIAEPLKILSGAAIPTMVMVLGAQLAYASWREDLRPAGVATLLRLVVSPALAYGVTLALGIDGLLQQVVIVLAGMPTAVYTTILATEFNAQPRLVTSSVAMSTGASMLTLTVLIWLVSTLL
ncbi:MAG: AEC family transporter [Chloroflexi bacterium]|nr:AEC family transporter [Chloroflexota bacterium]